MLNYEAAYSRITDADVAEETSKLIKLQILEQATAAILAKANLEPKIVLQLLG